MEEKEFDLLQEHSLIFLEMAFRTDKHESVKNPDGYGKKASSCGDIVEIFLSVLNDHIDSVSLQIRGCMNINACANVIAHMAEGKNLEEAWGISPETVFNYLQTLPPTHFHCAEMAVGAFHAALASHQENRRNPWKKLYR